jgi:hypothetical protein
MCSQAGPSVALSSSCERNSYKFVNSGGGIVRGIKSFQGGNFVLANYVTFLLSVQIHPMRDRLFWCVAKM